MKPYLNPALSPRERAEDLLKDLSLDEKMAQVNCYMFARDEDLENRHKCLARGIGVVSTLEFRGVPKKDCIARRNDIQKEVIEHSPHHIPAIFHMEGLCGLLFSDASCFPSGMARGASFDCELEYAIGKTVGDEAARMGITHVFAPVLDVTRDARFGRSYESYGEDETLVTRMGVSYALGVQNSEDRPLNVEGVAKHFLGFHRGAGGQHGSDCTIGERELREVYAKPFEACFRLSDLKGVMPCYNVLNGELVSLSSRYETKLLREELGFQGVAVSDYCAVMNSVTCNHVAASPVEAGLRAMKAGMDVEQQFPYGFGEELKAKFLSGEADIAILDRAVLRVLEAKFRMGLFEHPYIDEKDVTPAKGDALSRRSALESMVLLKNDGILPLQPVKRIAVVGYHASTARGYFGGYTNFSMYEGALGDKNTMAGLIAESGADPTYPGTTVYREDAYREVYEAALHRAFPAIRTLPEALKARFPESEVIYAYGYDFAGADESCFDEALKAIEGADAAILTLARAVRWGRTSTPHPSGSRPRRSSLSAAPPCSTSPSSACISTVVPSLRTPPTNAFPPSSNAGTLRSSAPRRQSPCLRATKRRAANFPSRSQGTRVSCLSTIPSPSARGTAPTSSTKTASISTAPPARAMSSASA